MSDRSQKRRDATRAEIKAAARDQLVRGGPGSISLRAIARDMGITAPALYRYYPALDSLVLELCTELYSELRLACEAARDRVPPDDLLKRLHEMAREFRRWVLAHPPDAALMFGPPLPGVEQFIEQCSDLQDAGACFAQIFIEPLTQLHAEGRLRVPVEAFFLSAWTRLYGVIMADAFGHLSWAVADGSALFEAELQAMTESLVSKTG
jgi:AcrR family transcriptional regulator